MRAVYRIRQLAAAVRARISEADLVEVDAHLPPEARVLFRSMPRDGQAHALRVMRDLKRAGWASPSLLAAALLHDAGKSAARITPTIRSAFVVLKRAAPTWLDRLDGGGWRASLVALRDHPRLGAEWARAAGCDAMTVSLIARHQEQFGAGPASEEDRLLRALQEADDRN